MPISKDLLPPGWTEDNEKSFARDLLFAPGWRDWRREFTDKMGGPPNTDPGGDYDYRRAWLYDAVPEKDPGTGETHGYSQVVAPPFKEPVKLKAEDHPTAWKQAFMERFGVNPDVALEAGVTTPEMDEFIGASIVPPSFVWGE